MNRLPQSKHDETWITHAVAERYLATEYASLIGWVRLRQLGKLKAADMSPEAVVHEMYVQLRKNQRGWASQAHLGNWMRLAIRHILIDAIRRRRVRPQASVRFEELRFDSNLAETTKERDLSVREAVERLERERPRQAAIVAMRHWDGCTVDDCAGRLGVSARTVKRDSSAAYKWLRQELAS